MDKLSELTIRSYILIVLAIIHTIVRLVNEHKKTKKNNEIQITEYCTFDYNTAPFGIDY